MPVFGYKSHIGADRRHRFIRSIGLARARIGLANTAYNLRRYLF